jgi:hypothetical protein
MAEYPLKGGRPKEPLVHGTMSGYKKELRRGLPTCPACRKAWRAYCKHNAEMRRELEAKGLVAEYEAARALLKDARIPPPPKKDYED